MNGCPRCQVILIVDDVILSSRIQSCSFYFVPFFSRILISYSKQGVEGWGRISRPGLTQDIKMGSCVFQCDVPHQWIAQRQVSPVSVYCDGVRCRVLYLRHGISVWQHTGQSTTATSRHRLDMTSDVSKRR